MVPSVASLRAVLPVLGSSSFQYPAATLSRPTAARISSRPSTRSYSWTSSSDPAHQLPTAPFHRARPIVSPPVASNGVKAAGTAVSPDSTPST